MNEWMNGLELVNYWHGLKTKGIDVLELWALLQAHHSLTGIKNMQCVREKKLKKEKNPFKCPEKEKPFQTLNCLGFPLNEQRIST